MHLRKLDELGIYGRPVLLTLGICLSLYFQWPLTQASPALSELLSFKFFFLLLILTALSSDLNTHFIPIWNKLSPINKDTYIESEITGSICMLFTITLAGVLLKLTDIRSAITIIAPCLIPPAILGYIISRCLYSRITPDALLRLHTQARARTQAKLDAEPKLDIKAGLKSTGKGIKLLLPGLLASLTYLFVLTSMICTIIAIKSFVMLTPNLSLLDNFLTAASKTSTTALDIASSLVILSMLLAISAGQLQTRGHQLRKKLKQDQSIPSKMGVDYAIGLLYIQSIFIILSVMLSTIIAGIDSSKAMSLSIAALAMTVSAFVAASTYSLFETHSPDSTAN